MKISVLIENTSCSESLKHEHGLSLYIEACGHRILFDSGQSGAFADNAALMGIDLSKVDTAVLSHGHFDHGGGLERFFEVNQKAKVYANKHVFEGHYRGEEKYIGLDGKLKDYGRMEFVDQEAELFEGARLYAAGGADPAEVRGENPPEAGRRLPYPIDSSGLTVKRNGEFLPEDFIHEQYLLLEEKNKRVLISGCSHRGILNIMNRFHPDVLVGGFHFMEIPTEGEGAKRLEQAAEELLGYETLYFTGHCTGQAQFDYLKDIMGERLSCISTGTVIKV